MTALKRNSQEKKQERAERLAEIKRNLRKNRLINDCRKTIDNRVTQDK